MEDLKGRDQSCRVSGIIDFCEQAHLVPAGEREWWDSNMGESNDLEIRSALNGMLLRADLHQSFDAGTWVPMAREGGRLVLYVVRMADVSNQFAALWHNTEMQRLVGVDRRCLFARVAWAVLSLHHEFLALRRLASDNLLVRIKGGELKEMAPEVFKDWLNNIGSKWIRNAAEAAPSPPPSMATDTRMALEQVYKGCKCPAHQDIYSNWPTQNAELTIGQCMKKCVYCGRELTTAGNLRKHITNDHAQQNITVRQERGGRGTATTPAWNLAII
jgi:hypothetical protein